MAMPRYERPSYQTNEQKKGPAPKNADVLLPWGIFRTSVALFPGLSKPLHVGSVIKSNPLLLALARELSSDESKKANIKFKSEAEGIIDSGEARQGQVVLLDPNRNPTYKVYAGEKNDPKGLYLYYRRARFNSEQAIYLVAIAKVKDSPKVDTLLTKYVQKCDGR